jgi:hypothetical protein
MMKQFLCVVLVAMASCCSTKPKAICCSTKPNANDAVVVTTAPVLLEKPQPFVVPEQKPEPVVAPVVTTEEETKPLIGIVFSLFLSILAVLCAVGLNYCKKKADKQAPTLPLTTDASAPVAEDKPSEIANK